MIISPDFCVVLMVGRTDRPDKTNGYSSETGKA
jgi:hypothetical protein